MRRRVTLRDRSIQLADLGVDAERLKALAVKDVEEMDFDELTTAILSHPAHVRAFHYEAPPIKINWAAPDAPPSNGVLPDGTTIIREDSNKWPGANRAAYEAAFDFAERRKEKKLAEERQVTALSRGRKLAEERGRLKAEERITKQRNRQLDRSRPAAGKRRTEDARKRHKRIVDLWDLFRDEVSIGGARAFAEWVHFARDRRPGDKLPEPISDDDDDERRQLTDDGVSPSAADDADAGDAEDKLDPLTEDEVSPFLKGSKLIDKKSIERGVFESRKIHPDLWKGRG